MNSRHLVLPNSASLIKARAANPDVLLLLVQGSDMINCLKQIVQFGLDKQIHVAGINRSWMH